MMILLNGKAYDTQALTLAALIEELDMREVKLATAANEEFVPAATREVFTLLPGMTVDIVTPMQGG